MKILGCDCSTKLIGLVQLEEDKISAHTIVSKKESMLFRIEDLFFQFREILKIWRPDTVVIEQAIFSRARPNIKTTLGIDAVVNAIRFNCLLESTYYQIIDNTVWKKDILGAGNASKEQIMEFAKHKWGDAIKNQDEADAACLALFGVRRLG